MPVSFPTRPKTEEETGKKVVQIAGQTRATRHMQILVTGTTHRVRGMSGEGERIRRSDSCFPHSLCSTARHTVTAGSNGWTKFDSPGKWSGSFHSFSLHTHTHVHSLVHTRSGETDRQDTDCVTNSLLTFPYTHYGHVLLLLLFRDPNVKQAGNRFPISRSG